MEPPPAVESRRRRGSKPRGGKSLGLRRPAAQAPSPSSGSPSPPVHPQPPISSPAATEFPAGTTFTTSAAAPNSTPTGGSFSPAAQMLNIRPPLGGGWGAVAPNFQQGPNSWLYPQGGFVNLIQQNYQPQAQPQAENFHLVGQTMPFNPMFTLSIFSFYACFKAV